MEKNTKIVVSLCGVKKSGKSTSAAIIKDILDTRNEVAFADKLKVELSLAYDIDLIHFHSQELKELDFIYPLRTTIEIIAHMLDAFDDYRIQPKLKVDDIYELASQRMQNPRELMQHWGMFLRSVYGKDVHCRTLEFDENITIVSDVRFMNEFNYLDKLEGITHIPLYIHNKEAEKSTDGHISEQEFKKIAKKCFLVDNNTKNLVTLSQTINDILGKVLNG